MLERLRLLIATNIAVTGLSAPLDEATGLFGHGIGLDSIEVLRLVAALEEEFHLEIDDADLQMEHFETVGALIGFVEAKLSSDLADAMETVVRRGGS
jgi:acyl carrier protein